MKNIMLILTFLLLGAAEKYQLPKGYQLLSETPVLINGRPVQPGEYPEIVLIRTGNAQCTATVIGPRVILTAAHCAETGSISRFQMDGIEYSAQMTRSPLYPSVDHDVALGLVDKFISIRFGNIAGTPGLSEKVILTGYGCTNSDGTGSDGVLRVGDSVVVGFEGYDYVTKRPDGSALCFGDSGGPSFGFMDDPFIETHRVMGVNSKGNIIDTSLITRTDHPDSQDFMQNFADTYDVDICGINRNCVDDPSVPPGCFRKFLKGMAKLLQSLSGCTGKYDDSLF